MRKEFAIRKNYFLNAAISAALTALIPLVILFDPTLHAQSAPPRPEFEVASIKLNTDDGRMDFVPVRSGDLVLMHNNQIGNMILYAYHPAQDSGAPSLYTALQEQLGLKLESTKSPVDVVVIDHIERPSGN